MAVIVGLALLAGTVTGGDVKPAAAPGPLVGEATYYADGVMEDVLAARLRWGHVAPCEECVDCVALLDCRLLGRQVWLVRPADATRPAGEVVGPLLVVDCAARQDAPRLSARGWVVDVSRELSLQWKMRGPLPGVAVLFRDPGKPVEPMPGNPRHGRGAHQDPPRRLALRPAGGLRAM